jgi:hypothetical protein
VDADVDSRRHSTCARRSAECRQYRSSTTGGSQTAPIRPHLLGELRPRQPPPRRVTLLIHGDQPQQVPHHDIPAPAADPSGLGLAALARAASACRASCPALHPSCSYRDISSRPPRPTPSTNCSRVSASSGNASPPAVSGPASPAMIFGAIPTVGRHGARFGCSLQQIVVRT